MKTERRAEKPPHGAASVCFGMCEDRVVPPFVSSSDGEDWRGVGLDRAVEKRAEHLDADLARASSTAHGLARGLGVSFAASGISPSGW